MKDFTFKIKNAFSRLCKTSSINLTVKNVLFSTITHRPKFAHVFVVQLFAGQRSTLKELDVHLKFGLLETGNERVVFNQVKNSEKRTKKIKLKIVNFELLSLDFSTIASRSLVSYNSRVAK